MESLSSIEEFLTRLDNPKDRNVIAHAFRKLEDVPDTIYTREKIINKKNIVKILINKTGRGKYKAFGILIFELDEKFKLPQIKESKWIDWGEKHAKEVDELVEATI